MKLGIGTYAFAWAIGAPGHRPRKPMSALPFVRRAAELGVSLVQIADNMPLHAMEPGELEDLLSEVRRLHLSVEVGARGIDPGSLRSYLRLAGLFGSPIVRTVIDTPTHQPKLGDVVPTLREIVPEFEQAGITLAVENHDRFASREFARIVEEVNSPHLGICLDTVNSFGALEGPEVVIRVLGPHVVNLHVKDFVVRRVDHNMGFVIDGRPAGSGLLHVPELLEELQSHGRDFNAILELWPAPEASLEETIRKEDAWATRSVAYLRKLIPA